MIMYARLRHKQHPKRQEEDLLFEAVGNLKVQIRHPYYLDSHARRCSSFLYEQQRRSAPSVNTRLLLGIYAFIYFDQCSIQHTQK